MGLIGFGSASGLEHNLNQDDCASEKSCGVHVHSGTACTDISTQGGHYFLSGDADPWVDAGYRKTSSTGAGTFSFSVATWAKDVKNKPFIVHNKAGARVACGMLKKQSARIGLEAAALSLMFVPALP